VKQALADLAHLATRTSWLLLWTTVAFVAFAWILLQL
jgi:hypothetical protein